MRWPLGHLSKTRFSQKAHSNILFQTLSFVEAKPLKSRITKSKTNFQIKLIRKLIYGNRFYKV